jgi:hypothetical protein
MSLRRTRSSPRSETHPQAARNCKTLGISVPIAHQHCPQQLDNDVAPQFPAWSGRLTTRQAESPIHSQRKASAQLDPLPRKLNELPLPMLSLVGRVLVQCSVLLAWSRCLESSLERIGQGKDANPPRAAQYPERQVLRYQVANIVIQRCKLQRVLQPWRGRIGACNSMVA